MKKNTSIDCPHTSVYQNNLTEKHGGSVVENSREVNVETFKKTI